MNARVYFPKAKKIALISDSHGESAMLREILPVLERTDGVIMLGDHAEDARALARDLYIPVVYVRGNCDASDDAPEEIYGRIGSEEGPVFYACHGHRYGVKENPLGMVYRAKELYANVAMYGHTHIPDVYREDGVLCVNPGALCNGYYALLRLDGFGLRAELLRLK